MNPPTKYPTASVTAEIHAWLQSGSDSLWWNAMRNSRSRSGEEWSEILISEMASSDRPYLENVAWTIDAVSLGDAEMSSFVSRTMVW